MKFDEAEDLYIEDKRALSEIASKHTEASYRYALRVLREQVDNRDPSKVGKRDVQRALATWQNPRTRAQRHSVYISFFDWAVEEDVAKNNPARAIRRPRIRVQQVQRLSLAEIVNVQDAAAPVRRDRWFVDLGLYLGARNAEIRGLTGADFLRDGVVRIHGKGSKTRWMPVLPPLEATIAEIRAQIEPDRYVLPGRRSSNPPVHTIQHDTQKMLSSSALQRQARRIGRRAELGINLHPHLLRHAFGDAVTRYAGARIAQHLMDHVSIQTTVDTYVGAPTIEELVASLRGFDYRRGPGAELSDANHPERTPDVTHAR